MKIFRKSAYCEIKYSRNLELIWTWEMTGLGLVGALFIPTLGGL